MDSFVNGLGKVDIEGIKGIKGNKDIKGIKIRTFLWWGCELMMTAKCSIWDCPCRMSGSFSWPRGMDRNGHTLVHPCTPLLHELHCISVGY